MTHRTWTREAPPSRWDDAKATVVGAAPQGALPALPNDTGATLPGEWWRVEEAGEVVGYGWMDCTWEGAEILLAVRPDRQRSGVGRFVLDKLEDEARSRGMSYVFNVVPDTHPRRGDVAEWLRRRGFEAHGEGQLRKHVVPASG